MVTELLRCMASLWLSTGYVAIDKYSVTNALSAYSLRYSLIYFLAICLFYYLNAFALRIVRVVLLKLHIDLESTWSIIIGALIAVALTFPMVMFINRYLPVLSGQKEAFNRISRALNLNIQW